MKRLTRIGTLLTTAVCILGIAATVRPAFTEKADTIEKGISIGNVDVGGMTEEEARSALEDYVNGLMDTTFTLQGETGSVQMTASDMGVTADTDTAVQEALAVGHAGSLINRYKTLQDLKKDNVVLDMHLREDKQETAQKL